MLSDIALTILIAVFSLGGLSTQAEPEGETRGQANAQVGDTDLESFASNKDALRDQANQGPPGVDPASSNPSKWYEYLTIVNCEGNTADNVDTEVCADAATFCAANGQGDAIWHRMYRRIVTREGDTGDWEAFGTTCFPDALPAQSGPAAPTLTIGQIVQQFHSTPFALPQTSMEPPGGQTLINLPTYYELQWPEDGVEPQEIDTTTLVGFNVRIRPTFVDATYDFGDGTGQGPVQSLGGTWPDGDIQHTYTTKTTVNPSISVQYGGEYSVNGDPWQPIPGTVTIDGPPQPLDILTSRNRLVSDTATP